VTAPAYQSLEIRLDGTLGRLTLNRPERLNAIGATMLRELADAARWFDSQTQVRAVIVSGHGRAFSAGADLRDSPVGEASPKSGRSWAERREVGQLGLRMADAVESMKAVTVAQLHGWIVGGGVVLAAACDLRVAAEDAAFSIPEIELGIPLAWGGIPRLVRELGPAVTKELVMTCRRFTPQEALQLRFLNKVVPASELAAAAESLARQVLAMPSVPITITKEHVNSVTRAMSAGTTSFADGDALLGAVQDPESLEAAGRYMARTFKKKP
jgi:enoyl-CoA hydratase/carnithine racemase